jgi:hypothetical protein
MAKYGDPGMGETGTKYTPPVKGPARSTSSDWVEPDTHAESKDKSGAPGCVDNVGKSAGAGGGKKGGKTKVW